MSTEICPFCGSNNVKRLREYCAAVSSESTKELMESIKPRFKYGIHVGIAGIVCVLMSIVVYNNSAYQNSFWDRDSVITINQNGGLGCAGLLGVLIIVLTGFGAILWGFKMHKENKLFSSSHDRDSRFYESADICRDCHNAWIPGFEETKRKFC